jgi:hypothetical protein
MGNIQTVGLEECTQAQNLARQCESSYSQLASLLLKIKEEELWRAVKASSFKEFVTGHLQLSDSLSRQLLKVAKLGIEQRISAEEIGNLGWSKLAEVAGIITKENKEEVLQDVSAMSQKELRAKYGTANERKNARKCQQKIVISEEILAAIQQAARFTHQDDLQVNLDFIATQFKLLHPVTPEPRFSLN